MDSLLSFPVELFHPYNMPVYPGALRGRHREGGTIVSIARTMRCLPILSSCPCFWTVCKYATRK